MRRALAVFAVGVLGGVVWVAAADGPVTRSKTADAVTTVQRHAEWTPKLADRYRTCFAYGEQPSGMWPSFLLVQNADDRSAPIRRMSIERARALAEADDRITYWRTIAVCE